MGFNEVFNKAVLRRASTPCLTSLKQLRSMQTVAFLDKQNDRIFRADASLNMTKTAWNVYIMAGRRRGGGMTNFGQDGKPYGYLATNLATVGEAMDALEKFEEETRAKGFKPQRLDMRDPYHYSRFRYLLDPAFQKEQAEREEKRRRENAALMADPSLCDIKEAIGALEKWEVAFTVRGDGTIFVPGDLVVPRGDLTELPDLSRVEVEGYFSCCENKLTTLRGAPQKTGSGFYCDHNCLVTLEGAPPEVKTVFSCTDNPDLKSLEHAPKSFTGLYSDMGSFVLWRQVPKELRYSDATKARMAKKEGRNLDGMVVAATTTRAAVTVGKPLKIKTSKIKPRQKNR